MPLLSERVTSPEGKGSHRPLYQEVKMTFFFQAVGDD